MRSTLLLLVAATAACATAPAPVGTPAPATPAPAAAAPSPISTAALRRDLTVFASDSFGGRETGTPGARKAADFIAARLRAVGVEPAGDSGTYFQRVPLTRLAIAPSSAIRLRRGGRVTAVPVGAQGLIAIPSLGEGAPLPKLSAQGDVVFVAYGASGQGGRNDLANLELRDKVVVYVHGAPAGVDSATREAMTSPATFGERLGPIVMRGPAAVVILVTGEVAEQFEEFAEQAAGGMQLGEPAAMPDGPRPLPMVMFGVAEGSPLVPDGWPARGGAGATGATLDAQVTFAPQAVDAWNVVGLVRGRDAAMNRSYVALGAHLDHIGIGAPVDGDSIANGADDDGSGSMALLQVAEAWARTPVKPRRSALFVWHTGEEKGLFGSEWFASHPPVPVDSIVAQLNADMVGRNAPDSLYIVGPMAAPNAQSAKLGAVIDSVNATLARPFAFNREWDDPNHPEQIYFRSDHYSYAQRGIPVVFFTTGLHDDYHKVSDEVEKIDFDKLARVADLLWRSSVGLADRGHRPK